MKLCVITDTHWGVRNDREVFYDYQKKFVDDVFLPCLKEYGITQVVHLGDLVDRRKYINFLSLKRLLDDFIQPMDDARISMDLILGNHDQQFKNTNEVNSPNLLLCKWPNVNVIDRPTLKNYGGLDIGLIPWICDDNKNLVSRFLKKTSAQVIFGHFELAGFEADKGRIMDHGMSASLLERFDVVASGHYHHKSSQKHIHYLGAPFQTSWTDYNDVRGFHIFDTETREFEFIPNYHADMFIKFIYDDKDMTLEQMLDFDHAQYAGKFVKVVVTNKSNPYMYDLVIDAIEKVGVVELDVVEDHFNLDKVDDVEIVRVAEDTLTSIANYVDAVKFGVDTGRLKDRLGNLYKEALNYET